jgi:hypothetical protein
MQPLALPIIDAHLEHVLHRRHVRAHVVGGHEGQCERLQAGAGGAAAAGPAWVVGAPSQQLSRRAGVGERGWARGMQRPRVRVRRAARAAPQEQPAGAGGAAQGCASWRGRAPGMRGPPAPARRALAQAHPPMSCRQRLHSGPPASRGCGTGCGARVWCVPATAARLAPRGHLG